MSYYCRPQGLNLGHEEYLKRTYKEGAREGVKKHLLFTDMSAKGLTSPSPLVLRTFQKKVGIFRE